MKLVQGWRAEGKGEIARGQDSNAATVEAAAAAGCAIIKLLELFGERRRNVRRQLREIRRNEKNLGRFKSVEGYRCLSRL